MRTKVNFIIGLILVLSFNLFGDGVQPVGTGTENEPYQIASLDNLLWISTNQEIWTYNAYFIQTADIDASDTQIWNNGEGFSPIGTDYDNYFSGNYNGQNYEIDGLYINRPLSNFQGLFGITNGVTIECLGLINIDISGSESLGGLVGNNSYSSIITNCYTTGNLSGDNDLGGLVGKNNFSSIISNCNSSVNVSGNYRIGGLVGDQYSATVTLSYSAGDINATSSVVGGLVGYNRFDSVISNCYSTSSVVGFGSTVGGLVGFQFHDAQIRNSFSTGSVVGAGGLLGDNSWNCSVTNSFWDTETSGQASSAGGTGKTTAEMQDVATFTDFSTVGLNTPWDFVGNPYDDTGTEDYWNIGDVNRDSYPYLSWQFPSLTANFTANIVNIELGGSIHFTCTSTGNPTGWLWDFENDGVIDSDEQNPIWLYEEAGIFSVLLTISDNENTETELKLDYVLVNLTTQPIQPLGFGTEDVPYQITSLSNLRWISDNVDSWDNHFIQTANIDAADTQNWNEGMGFNPIGSSSFFSGNYDGQNYTVEDLFINRSNSNNVGLFSQINGAVVENIKLIDADVSGLSNVGSLVGTSGANSVIRESSGDGIVYGNSNVGGLVGYNNNTNIIFCYTGCTVNGSDSSIGGLIGSMSEQSAVLNCYSISSVNGNSNVGGLVGDSNDANISNCYSMGNVNGNEIVGGLVGAIGEQSSVFNCYSNGSVNGDSEVGGLVGDNFDSDVSNSFWNIETSGQTASSGGSGKTTIEMQDVATFTDLSTAGLDTSWDFIGNPFDDLNYDDYWNVDEVNNNGYVYLSWQFSHPVTAEFSVSINLIELGEAIQFTDLSFGNQITSWQWDFDNDGFIDSEEQNPQWTYGEAGIYSVVLTVSDNEFEDSELKTDCISVIILPAGLGTEEVPYQISNLGNLIWISENPLSWEKHFIQTADIDVLNTQNSNDGEGFSPIGLDHYNPFSGNYDGQDYSIDGLFINRPDSDNIGLFGYIDGAVIENIELIDVDISGLSNVGSLVGKSEGFEGHTVVRECSSNGIVNGSGFSIGGLIGSNEGYWASVLNCYSIGSVNGNSSVGGLVGYSYDVNISLCYSSCTVDGSGSSIGGLIGNNYGYFSSISNSYSIGNVNGNEYVGGLVGTLGEQSSVLNCYSMGNVIGNSVVGGLVGDNFDSNVSNSFWNTETSGQTTSSGGTGKTTVEMQNVATFTDLSTTGIDTAWDFIGNPFDDLSYEDYWDIDIYSNAGYPQLSWEQAIIILTAEFNVDQTNVNIGNEIQFTDLSVGNSINWEWDFENDGVVDSYEQNPLFTYSFPGIYSVSLIISDGTLNDTIIKENYITINQIQEPSIVVEPTFIEFGNVCINETAVLQITVHNYGAQTLEISNILSSTDRFSVSVAGRDNLRIRGRKNVNIEESVSKAKQKKLKEKLRVSLSETQENSSRDLSFSVPSLSSQILDVSFSPVNLGEVIGSMYFLTNDPQNLMLTYSVSGIGYEFTADFSANPISGDIPLEVEFTNNSVGDILSYFWEFGSGETSALENPNHTYNEEGVYSVSLTITDNYHQKIQIQNNLITAIGHPILFSADSLGIDFGSLYLTNSSGDSLIVIQNIGTKAFQISEIDFEQNIGGFNFSYQNLGLPILPNESDTIFVNFDPASVGSYTDCLLITNSSENCPAFEIDLEGICEFVPPVAPQNVELNIAGTDGVISWESVTENIYGSPLNPDGYLVYYNEIAYGNEEDYYFLAFVENDTTYTHLNVARFSPQMFYKVVAFVELTRAEQDYFESLNASRRNVKMLEISQNLKILRKSKH